jgi:hypothetical protein
MSVFVPLVPMSMPSRWGIFRVSWLTVSIFVQAGVVHGLVSR